MTTLERPDVTPTTTRRELLDVDPATVLVDANVRHDDRLSEDLRRSAAVPGPGVGPQGLPLLRGPEGLKSKRTVGRRAGDRVSQWKPLSVRMGKRDDDGPFEGMPEHLWSHVRYWAADTIDNHSSGFAENRLDTMIALRLRIHQRTSLSMNQSIMSVASDDDDIALDVLDMILYATQGVGHESLESILAVGGSAWRVSESGIAIERRVLEHEALAYEEAVVVDDEATTELREAWAKTYGRHPDPSDAWDHSIHAQESVLWPIVQPNNAKATLPALTSALAKNPEQWSFRLATSSDRTTNIEALVQMLKLVWPNPDRHATGPTRPPTPDEARNVVHMAILVVSWVRSGALQRL